MELNNGACVTPTVGMAPAIFTSALQYFAAMQCLVGEDWPPDAKVDNMEQFDFIIVGAGTAGSVVANRLSEVDKWKVLLIEAGDNPPIESIIPSMSGTMYRTQYDWQYQTESDGRTNKANKNETVLWPRGKMLGGSSSINAMIYFRGNDHDYQEWYNEGNKEWHPDIVRKCFDKAESLQDYKLLQNPTVSQFYGHSGPLVINSFNNTKRSVLNSVLSAWNEIGIKTVTDLNAANVMGSGMFRVTASNGSRNSAAKAYLNTIQKRSNLKIIKRTLATKILIHPHTNVAYGVEVEQNGEKKLFFAKREVILSAGVINTPQLLMLSGIGPKSHLDLLNITCYADLPAVGQNLQDHLIIPVTVYGNESRLKVADSNFDTIKYLRDRTGKLAQGTDDISAFYSVNKNATFPHFQNHFYAFNKGDPVVDLLFSSISNYKAPVVESIAKLSENNNLFCFLFTLLHPFSRGKILLRTNNPKDKPLIYANYFDDPRDIEAAIDGIKLLTKITKTDYFKSIGGFLGRMNWPECNQFELDSREYWKCICLNFVITIYHPVGTARMGIDDKKSVVDSRLRVHGVKNLRVIDASVMPTETSGNTNGPVFMIGERASDLIKEDYGLDINIDK